MTYLIISLYVFFKICIIFIWQGLGKGVPKCNTRWWGRNSDFLTNQVSICMLAAKFWGSLFSVQVISTSFLQDYKSQIRNKTCPKGINLVNFYVNSKVKLFWEVCYKTLSSCLLIRFYVISREYIKEEQFLPRSQHRNPSVKLSVRSMSKINKSWLLSDLYLACL